MKKDTLLTHIGRDPSQTHGTVNMPVYRTSTVVFPDLESYETRDPDDYKAMRYGIHGTPTTFAFEDAVTRMEGGYQAVAVPSGLAAITAALCAFVKMGDHLLVTDSAYVPTRLFCDRQLRANGVEVEYYDPQTNNQGRLVHLRRQAYFLTAHAIQIPSFYSYQIFLGLAHIKKVNWGFL